MSVLYRWSRRTFADLVRAGREWEEETALPNVRRRVSMDDEASDRSIAARRRPTAGAPGPWLACSCRISADAALRTLFRHPASGLARLRRPLPVLHRAGASTCPAPIGAAARCGCALRSNPLGGAWIKLGQMLALRFDLLPAAYCNELFNLLNKVAPFPYADVREIVRERARRRSRRSVFKSFAPESFAAASIGQVHRAVLHNGDPSRSRSSDPASARRSRPTSS